MRENGLNYTLTAPGGTVQLNPTGFTGTGWYIDSGGMNFQPGLNAARSSRTQQHGSYLDNAYKDGLVGAIRLLNMASNATTRQSQSDNLVTVLSSLTGEDGTGQLSWLPQDGGASRSIYGLQLIEPYTFEQVAGTLKSVSFLLGTEKPYCESTSITYYSTTALIDGGSGFVVPLTVPFTLVSSGGGTVDVSNYGSVTSYPKVRIYGPIVDPIISDTGRDLRLVLTGSIAAGDYWEVDLFERTIRLNGQGTTSPCSIDLSQSDWFGIPVGSANLQLTGSGYNSNSYLYILMRNTWG